MPDIAVAQYIDADHTQTRITYDDGRILVTEPWHEAWPDAEAFGPAEYEPDPDPAQPEPVLTRLEFAFALNSTLPPIIADAELADFLRGNLPASFTLNPAFLALTARQKLDIEATWAGLDDVPRSHPFVAMAAGIMGLSETDVDAIFGIGV